MGSVGFVVQFWVGLVVQLGGLVVQLGSEGGVCSTILSGDGGVYSTVHLSWKHIGPWNQISQI